MSNVVELPSRGRKEQQKSKLLKVPMDDTQFAVLDQEAKRLHCSRAQLVRSLIANHLIAEVEPNRSVAAG